MKKHDTLENAPIGDILKDIINGFGNGNEGDIGLLPFYDPDGILIDCFLYLHIGPTWKREFPIGTADVVSAAFEKLASANPMNKPLVSSSRILTEAFDKERTRAKKLLELHTGSRKEDVDKYLHSFNQQPLN
jgi:hypothetical protein